MTSAEAPVAPSATAAPSPTEPESESPPPAPRRGGESRLGARQWWPVGALAVAVAALVAWGARSTHGLGVTDAGGARANDASALRDDLVIVAPFRVLAPGLELWREGMVDVLARDLDGAGPLRAVSPSSVVGHWRPGPIDRASVASLARSVGAGLAVFGGLLPAGRDSVRARMTLIDVASGRVLAEREAVDAVSHMDRLTDSLSVAVLRALGERRAIGAVRHAGFGSTTSLAALRAFLQGEQFYRRAQWDSAAARYEAAVAQDSTFALAWRRLGLMASWRRLLSDSLSTAYLLRAGALNHGLGTRDSLLVVADSLSGAAAYVSDDLAQWPYVRRLYATLAELRRRDPDDPEVWFAIGEAGYHYGSGPLIGVSDRAILDAFDRSIALDSAFAPAYIHPVELGFNVGGAPLGLRYARAYLARDPSEPAHRGVRLVEAIFDSGSGGAAGARALDTASAATLVSARTILRRATDPEEMAVRLSRLLAAGGRPSDYLLYSDTSFMRRRLAQELAYRGHLADAYRALGVADSPTFAELALLGAVPTDTARTTFARWTREGFDRTHLALPWWSSRRDTAAIAEFRRRTLARAAAADVTPNARLLARYDVASADAHLALAIGDSALALQRFTALPDTLCVGCYLDRLTRARLLVAYGRDRDALRDLSEAVAAYASAMEVVFAAERARVASRLGERSVAESASRLANAAWVHGDPAARALIR